MRWRSARARKAGRDEPHTWTKPSLTDQMRGQHVVRTALAAVAVPKGVASAAASSASHARFSTDRGPPVAAMGRARLCAGDPLIEGSPCNQKWRSEQVHRARTNRLRPQVVERIHADADTALKIRPVLFARHGTRDRGRWRLAHGGHGRHSRPGRRRDRGRNKW